MDLSINSGEAIAQLSALSPEQLAALDAGERTLIEKYVGNELARTTDALCRADALRWLQGYTKTENPQYVEQGRQFLAPFPKKPYFVPLFRAFKEQHTLFIPKSRTMMTSWSAMGWASHQAQWEKAEVIVQTENEGKAAELIDYCRQLYEHQDGFLSELHPLKVRNTFEIAWQGGGRVLSIPKGETKIRLYHPSLYIQDESAYLPEGEECFNAAKPTGCRVICISSAAPGWFEFQCDSRGVA